MTSEQQPLTEDEQTELAGLMRVAERGALTPERFERAAELNVRNDTTQGSTSGAAR